MVWQENSKKGTPFGSQKPFVGIILGKSRCHSEKPNTLSDLPIQQKSQYLMALTF